MTISTYQVDSVIRAYSKQHRSRLKADFPGEATRDPQGDTVTISSNDQAKADFYAKVSYTLLDAIRRNRPAE